jgi:putative FmdB family regulatory protein
MPTYSYKCESCDHEFESLQKMNDRDNPTQEPCPACSKSAIIRTPGIGGHQFNDVQKPSGDWKNLLENLKRKNSSMSNPSTIHA